MCKRITVVLIVLLCAGPLFASSRKPSKPAKEPKIAAPVEQPPPAPVVPEPPPVSVVPPEPIPPPVPVPPPVPTRPRIKADWKSSTDAGYRAWAEANGFTAAQWWAFWSIPLTYNPSYPFGVESATARSYSLEMERDRVLTMAKKPDWILLDCEWPRGEATLARREMFREVSPASQIWTGPIPWANPNPADFDGYDGTVTFYNPNYDNRMGEDIAYVLAAALYVGKPYIIMPQPITGGDNLPGIPDEFRRGLEIACVDVDGKNNGLMAWGTDRLFTYRDDPRVVEMMSAWKAATRKPMDASKVRLVKFTARNPFGYNEALPLCRIVWHAGFVPKLDMAAGLTWADIAAPVGYADMLAAFRDFGHPARVRYTTEQLREAVRHAEQAMAGQVK